MQILRKLLVNLGDMWNKVPKDIAFLTITQGTGIHSLISVDAGSLYFHSMTFRSDLPQRQTVVLDDLTTSDLLAIITGMGYIPTIASEATDIGLDDNSPFVLMEVADVAMGTTLTAFTSNLWRTLYPVYRVLRQANNDTTEAMKQVYRDLSDGEWLDFWASFFPVKRSVGESDNNFVRRFTMWLFNPKTNNIALKELLAYQLQDTNVNVDDTDTPLEFAVTVGTKYIDDASALHAILIQAKAAGVTYFLNFQNEPYSEDYRVYLADALGSPWETSDMSFFDLIKTSTDTFPMLATQNDVSGFQLNMSQLNTDALYGTNLIDIVVATLTVGGVVVDVRTF